MKTNQDLKTKQKMLLHVCCAPCATSVLEKLTQLDMYEITLYFSNSNIMPKAEYDKRLDTLKEFISKNYKDIQIIEDQYNNSEYFEIVKNNLYDKEHGTRCTLCLDYRLHRTAKYAKANNFDIFATTLTVSPYKNASLINQLGQRFAEEYGVEYLVSDFKKQNGYLRSIQICKEQNIYRQNYCGCNFEGLNKN